MAKPRHLCVSRLIAAAVLLMTGHVLAVDVNIRIRGEIIIPPCRVNNGGSIEVDFGDVPITDVSNAKFRKITTIPVTCTYYQGRPYVRVIGTQMSGASGNVVNTNIRNFGIALYQGNGISLPMSLGSGTSNGNGGFIGYQLQDGLSGGQFTFTAVPYKQGTAELQTGAFTASASMSISYM